MRKYRHIFLIIIILGFVSSLILINCKRDGSDQQEDSKGLSQLISAEYVGRESCVECHELQHELFMDSDHDRAMEPATDEYVEGDFDNAEFTHLGLTHKFYKKDDKYFVYTQGPEGEFQEFEIKYTFGIRPLQQYLIEFPGGRYQCLPLSWDTRPKEEGGQQWFHVYGDEEIKPDDILYWTSINQNWNYMCAECHSTNLRKHYDHPTRTYNTTWSEIDVSCEACHGPGSEHIAWAEIVESGGNPETFPDMGLTIRLKDTDNATWIFDPDSVNARRSVPREKDIVVQMCSRCHSRRSVLTEDYFHGGSLLNTHWPSLLDEGLYFSDGQILEEVYVYASFLQSKMYQEGVSCKDCHETHSGQVYVQGNALCYRCHMASEYGTREHHFHDPEQEGASCFECHMHERTYMQVDPRRDHSIRNPRPDLSDELGTPNSCIQCHPEETNQWAIDYMIEWYGTDVFEQKHYGEAIYAGRRSFPQAYDELVKLGTDPEQPPMVRATVIKLLSNYSDPGIIDVLRKTIQDPDPLIRYATLEVVQYNEPEVIRELCLPRLNDTVRLVRIMAAYVGAELSDEMVPGNYKNLLKEGIAEYESTLKINKDHPNTHMNYGNLALKLGDLAKAESSYREALKIEPGLVAPYINLADLYRRLGRDQEGEEFLQTALERYPEIAAIHYSLGLLYVRQKQNDLAVSYLKNAAELEPENAQYSYVYAIGLNSTGKPLEAIKHLESALEENPYDRNILYTLATLNEENGNHAAAVSYARRLIEYYPENQNFRQLLQALGGGTRNR